MPARINHPRYCTMEWCDDLLYAKGKCRNCYDKSQRGTLVDPRLGKPEKPRCSFPGCDHPRYTKNIDICRAHYMQRYLGKELSPLRRWNTKDAGDKRKCRTCGQWKDRETGYYRTSNGGTQGECKPCMVKRNGVNNYARKLRKEGVNV